MYLKCAEGVAEDIIKVNVQHSSLFGEVKKFSALLIYYVILN